jgi:transcription initiation factor TFIIIB Brf1 subunit/transcription initiation factor TFIIB
MVIQRAQSGPHQGCPIPSPCPFCGLSNDLRYEFAGSQGYIVCDNCGAIGPCDEQAADPHCNIDAAYKANSNQEVAEMIRWLEWQSELAFNADMLEESVKIDRIAELLALAGGTNA